MAGKGSVIIVVSGEDKTGEVFNSIKKHLDETQTAAKETSESLGNIGELLKSGLETAGISIGLREIIGGFKEMVSTAMEAGVQLGHLSQQTGISVENLSVLKYAATATGIEFETLTKAFKKLSTETYEAENGSKVAQKAFSDLGISTADLKAKGNNLYAVMAMLADKFKDMPDGIQKNALATTLFGRAGQQLIPILNQGAAGIDKFRSEAESLGLVMDESGVKKMEDMHRATAQMQGAFAGLSLEITADLAPSLTKLANSFTHLIEQWRNAPWNMVKGGFGELFGFVDPDKQFAAADAAIQGKNSMAPGQLKPPPVDTAAAVSSGVGNSSTRSSSLATGAMTINPARIFQWVEEQTKISDDNKAFYAKLAAEAAAGLAKIQADAAAGEQAALEMFKTAGPSVSLYQAIAPKPQDFSAVDNQAEKFAHGLFDPLFNFGERWDKKWKQIRANMLKDIGNTAESQLFGALFGDPSGRGGRGWDGSGQKGHQGVQGAGGLLGSILGSLNKPSIPGVTSNGGMGAGAGTVPSAAASLLGIGKQVAGGAAGVQVVINNQGSPVEATATQQSGGGVDPEQMVIQIMMKQLETNGPIAQGFAGLIGLG